MLKQGGTLASARSIRAPALERSLPSAQLSQISLSYYLCTRPLATSVSLPLVVRERNILAKASRVLIHSPLSAFALKSRRNTRSLQLRQR